MTKIEYRSIDRTIVPANIVRPDPGREPELQWLPVENLILDSNYQRDIRADGRARIRRIAGKFSWTKFAPVVVTPFHDSGLYAIIDGQHRTTAAAGIGIERVPCLIIYVDVAGAAESFAAINGEITRVHALERFRARIAAGDPEAIALSETCKIAGIEICAYPICSEDMKPGQTVALVALESSLAKVGRDTMITALQCVTLTENNVPGALRGPIIRALCQLMHNSPLWREGSAGALLDAFDDIDVMDLYERASRSSKNGMTGAELCHLLKIELVRKLGPPIAIGATA